MRNPFQTFCPAPALLSAFALACLVSSSGCGAGASAGAADDSTATAPKLTLADSLADHRLPYQDLNGKWITHQGEGFSLRQPETFEQMRNLEGGYIWVLQLPPVERRQWITLYAEPSDSPAKSLQALGDASVAGYADKSGKATERASLGKGDNSYQWLNIQWHMHSDRGVAPIDTDMETRLAIWQAKGNAYYLRLTSKDSIHPADAEVFDKVAMSMRVE